MRLGFADDADSISTAAADDDDDDDDVICEL